MMRSVPATLRVVLLVVATFGFVTAHFQRTAHADQHPDQHPGERAAYIGFDRNDYPGDSNLKVLRQTFSYAGYWLNNPPGAKTNSWKGKRKNLQAAGFGFLVLFNGRTYAEIKSSGDAAKLGG